MSEELIIEPIEVLRELVYRRGSRLGYIVIDEVLNRKKRRAVARMDLTPEALAEHLDEEEDLDDLTLEDEEAPENDPPEDVDLDAETATLCRALLRWLPDEVDRLLGDRAQQTFKLSLYEPKGGYLTSKNFQATRPGRVPAPDEESEPALPMPPVPAPSSPAPSTALALPALVPPKPAPPATTPPPPVAPGFAIALGGDGHGQLVFLDPDTIPEARVWRALGKATEELLVTVGRTYSGIIELQARTVLHQSEQLDRSQRLVENLAGQLLAARRVQERDDAETRADESQLRVREELGKTFLSELGTLGRVLVTSRAGVAPELAELSELVSGSPELAETLRDPDVRALLKDEHTTKELAQLLRLAARRSSGGDSGAPQAA